MISTQEAKTRKLVGGILLAWHFVVNLMNTSHYLPNPSHQSAVGCVLGGAGVMLYQMGRDSQ